MQPGEVESYWIKIRDTSLHPLFPYYKPQTYLYEKTSPSLYITMGKIVNTITDDLVREAEEIENDPQKILALIDLIFMYEDNKKVIPS
jgi:hypothetical protein